MLSRETTLGIGLITVALGMAGAAITYGFANWQPPRALDADDCTSIPTGTSIAVVDMTDVWPNTEQDRITKSILNLAERMHKNDRLILTTITGNVDEGITPWQGFRRCKSADPATVNPAIQNEALERADYERQFLSPLKELLPKLVQGQRATQSPILEVIEALMWSPHFKTDVQRRTLNLNSDLLQHSKTLSHLSGQLPKICSVLASPIGLRLKGHDWRGVRVILTYLRNPRDAHLQGVHHVAWWAMLFYQIGAAEVFDGATLIANAPSPCPSKTTRTSDAPLQRKR
jgi:hypothetical protein